MSVPPSALLRRLGLAVAVVLFFLLAWRQHRMVSHYAVNLFFWDQWDFYFYSPLVKGHGWWATYDFQFGPHRQGLGLVIVRLLTPWTAWDGRWDSFSVSFAVMIAAGFGWLLALKCGVRATAALAAIPLIFFNRHQAESFTGAANLAHGGLPVLLFMLFGLAWFIASPALRYPALALLTFFLTYTGFGVFGGLVGAALIALATFQAFRSHQRAELGWGISALAAVSLSWGLFLSNYVFQSAIPNFRFPYEKPWEYVLFVELMLANFFGATRLGAFSYCLGGALLAALIGLAIFHGWRILRQGVLAQRRSTVIFALTAFTLIYCANTSIGRVMLGYEAAATASRYVTLLIPAGFALFLAVSSYRPSGIGRWLGVAFAILLVPATLEFRPWERANVESVAQGRRAWRTIYLETRSQDQANQRAHFQVHPFDLTERLKYLEEHKLNLFDGR